MDPESRGFFPGDRAAFQFQSGVCVPGHVAAGEIQTGVCGTVHVSPHQHVKTAFRPSVHVAFHRHGQLGPERPADAVHMDVEEPCRIAVERDDDLPVLHDADLVVPVFAPEVHGLLRGGQGPALRIEDDVFAAVLLLRGYGAGFKVGFRFLHDGLPDLAGYRRNRRDRRDGRDRRHGRNGAYFFHRFPAHLLSFRVCLLRGFGCLTAYAFALPAGFLRFFQHDLFHILLLIPRVLRRFLDLLFQLVGIQNVRRRADFRDRDGRDGDFRHSGDPDRRDIDTHNVTVIRSVFVLRLCLRLFGFRFSGGKVGLRGLRFFFHVRLSLVRRFIFLLRDFRLFRGLSLCLLQSEDGVDILSEDFRDPGQGQNVRQSLASLPLGHRLMGDPEHVRQLRLRQSLLFSQFRDALADDRSVRHVRLSFSAYRCILFVCLSCSDPHLHDSTNPARLQ